MIDKLQDALRKGDLTQRDLEGAQKIFEFLANSLKETRVELAMQGVGDDAEIVALLRQGQRIPAIKRYREIVPGSGLKEAKDATDRLCRDLGLPPFDNQHWGHRP